MNLSKHLTTSKTSMWGTKLLRFLGCVVTIALMGTNALAQRSGTVHSPAVAWTFTCKAPIISSPVVDGGLVYFGAGDSIWYALDAASGRPRWKIPTNGAIRSNPVVYKDRVYLAGGNGVLICADKLTGKIVWRVVFDQTATFMGERTYDFADYYHSTPTMDGDILYLASGSGAVSAYRTGSGRLIWRYQAQDIIHSQPVVAANKVIVGCFDGHVLAIDKNNGQLVWKFKTIGHQYFPKGEVQGVIATDGSRVFTGARDYNFYAIDAASGNAVWNIKFDNGWAMSATVADTVVYIGTSDDRIMLAVDARSGMKLWKTDVKFNTFGAGVISQHELIFGTIWGRVYGLNSGTGVVSWTFETEGFRNHHSEFFDEHDRFRSDIGQRLKSPHAWISAEHRLGGIFSTPGLSTDLIVITTTDGKVYALKRS